MMEFEWDPVKARDNLTNHKVSFEEARHVFYDLYAIDGEDRVEDGEWRSVIIGMVAPNLAVIAVAYAIRGKDVIRIISARKANRKERKQYGKAR